MTSEVTNRAVSQIQIKAEGSAIPARMHADLLEAVLESSVHLPDMATLSFIDNNFEWSDSHHLEPGHKLEIALGDADEAAPMFIGEVTAVEIIGEPEGGSRVVVRAYDRAHRLHRGRKTRTFLRASDSEIAKQIAGEVSLSASVDAAKAKHDYVIQNNLTDWEFLRERARLNGFELQVVGDTLIFKKPPSTPADDITLTYGDTLLSFRAEMSAAEQVSEVEVRGWDPKAKKEIVGTAKRGDTTTEMGERDSGGALAARSFNDTARLVITREHVESGAHADAIAQAALNELEQAFVRLEGVAIGQPKLRLGSKVKLDRAGRRFSGSYYVTEVTHRYAQDGFLSSFTVSGLRGSDVYSLVAAGADPARPSAEVFNGVVTDTNDPDNLGRVKVRLPHLADDVVSDWCRVVALGAGPDRGIQFLPEVDDEVLLVGGDINRPYVIGGLWNQKDAMPEPTSKNVSGGEIERRIIKSRTGHVITLDDSQNSPGITIEDSTGSNRIAIDTRQNSMQIAVDGDLTISAGGAIKIEAAQDISIEANGQFTAKANTNATLEAGANASVEAGAQLALKGTVAASLEGGASTQIKGATVSIGP
jgi:phage protein D